MTDDERDLRRKVIAAARQLNATGLNQGTSGNVSARWCDGLLITPSGMAYEDLEAEDIVFLHPDGRAEGRRKPSSEWRFHRDILAERPDTGAVVHAHPTYCTVLAIRRMEIPPVHYMIAAAGGPNVRCADYATFGTAELSANALAALEGRNACLLANHGMIAVGPDLDKALWLAVELETLARQYVLSLTIGGPVLLSDAEIERNIEKFKSYGPDAQDAEG